MAIADLSRIVSWAPSTRREQLLEDVVHTQRACIAELIAIAGNDVERDLILARATETDAEAIEALKFGRHDDCDE